MKPPYHPGHVEQVVRLRNQEFVTAACSCGWRSWGRYRLGTAGVARSLIADLDTHRATYVHRAQV